MSEFETEESKATELEIAAARRLYANDDVNIDDNALASHGDDGDVWVQAWVFVPGDAVKVEGGEAAATAQARPIRYVLKAADGRMVTNDTCTGAALTANVALAYVWTDATAAEAQRNVYEVVLGLALAVEVQPAERAEFTTVHTCPDGQVFGVEDVGEGEYQAVYPEQFAELSCVWASKASALDVIKADVDRYLRGELTTEVEPAAIETGTSPRLAERNDETSVPLERKVFEVTGFGFDGATDDTDDRVFSVAASDLKVVRTALEGTGAKFCGCLTSSDDRDVDFVLPDQVDELRIALMRWNTDAHETLVHEWQLQHGEAAAREGWSIFDCDGSDSGRWQLCQIDDAEEWSKSQGCQVPQLTCDDDAWNLVHQGSDDHHRLALQLISIVNPKEFKAISDYVTRPTGPVRTRP